MKLYNIKMSSDHTSALCAGTTGIILILQRIRFFPIHSDSIRGYSEQTSFPIILGLICSRWVAPLFNLLHFSRTFRTDPLNDPDQVLNNGTGTWISLHDGTNQVSDGRNICLCSTIPGSGQLCVIKRIKLGVTKI